MLLSDNLMLNFNSFKTHLFHANFDEISKIIINKNITFCSWLDIDAEHKFLGSVVKKIVREMKLSTY